MTTPMDKLAKLREWAIALVDSDDMTQWGSHEGYSHGVEALRIIDDAGEMTWDKRGKGWR